MCSTRLLLSLLVSALCSFVSCFVDGVVQRERLLLLPAADQALLASHIRFLEQLQQLAEANSAFLQEVLRVNGHSNQDEDSDDGLAGIESEVFAAPYMSRH